MPDGYSRKGKLTQNAAERKLAEALVMLKSLGIGFRKQAPKGGTVVNFTSDEAKLVIELDTNQEPDERQARYNATRAEVLETRGYRFLRFWSKDVDRNLATVMASVMGVLRDQHEAIQAAKAAQNAQAASAPPDQPPGENGNQPPRRRKAAGL
jgi:very-short-patch-repair endonuclease